VAGFPPQRPGFDPRSGLVGFVLDKVALGQVFSEYFGFPCQFSFHRLLHNHHLSPGAGKIGQIVANVSIIGLSLTPPQEIKKQLHHYAKNRWELETTQFGCRRFYPATSAQTELLSADLQGAVTLKAQNSAQSAILVENTISNPNIVRNIRHYKRAWGWCTALCPSSDVVKETHRFGRWICFRPRVKW
jgi:hypothetical protein